MTTPQLGPHDRCPACGQTRGYFHDLPGECKPPKPARENPSNVHHLDRHRDQERTSRYAQRALDDETNAVADAVEGTRNDTLNTAAYNLGQLIAAHALDYDTVRDALTEAAHTAGLPDHEIEATLSSGLTAGQAEPREIPDPESTPEATVLDDSGQTDVAASDGALLNPIINWHELLSAEDDGEDWILEPLLPARRLVALYSAPKVGKSLLMLEIAVAIAQGGQALGTTVTQPHRVLYVDFENDPRGDIRARLEAMGYGPENAHLLDNLAYLSFPSLAKLDTPTGAADLLRHLHEYDCTVVTIDTVSRAISGEENDNDTWLAFYRHTGLALKQAGAACIRLDHSGKDAEKGMRGGSAKYGDVDAVWRLTALSESTLQLECTDHRMPIDATSLVLLRRSWPLRHDLSGNPREVAIDAEEQQILDRLDALDVPVEASKNAHYKALREAGYGFNRQRVLRVAGIRKLRLGNHESRVDHSGSGTTLEPPGTTGSEVVPGGPLRSRAPEPPAATGSQNREPPPTTVARNNADEGDRLVACTRCYHPTDERLIHKTHGLCMDCFSNQNNPPTPKE